MLSSPRYASSCAHLALILAVASTAFSRSATGQSTPSAALNHRQPVLVELFTSEGCSDCPPADALLARLDTTQFVPGTQAIVLSEHVTYWNHLGWRDPFSLEQMDQRQRKYGSRFALDGVYTPQVVVDGEEQIVGNDVTAVSRAVAHASLAPKVEVAIDSAQWKDGGIQFTVSGTAPNANLVAALAEDATRSEVARGENAGRTLHHIAVVRVLKDFGSDAKGTLELSGSNLTPANGGMRSGRQGCESSEVKVLAPSITWFGRLAYPVRATVTKRVLPGRKSLSCSAVVIAAVGTTWEASKLRGLNITKYLQPRNRSPWEVVYVDQRWKPTYCLLREGR